MRIVCPACGAAYEVPDALLGSAPRRLRCARCGEEWAVDAPAADAGGMSGAVPSIPDPPSTQDDPAAERLEPPGPPPIRVPDLRAAELPVLEPGVPELRVPDSPHEGMRRRDVTPSGGTALLAWVLSLVVFGGLAASAFVWRERIIAVWPPSERVYAVLGLTPRPSAPP